MVLYSHLEFLNPFTNLCSSPPPSPVQLIIWFLGYEELGAMKLPERWLILEMLSRHQEWVLSKQSVSQPLCQPESPIDFTWKTRSMWIAKSRFCSGTCYWTGKQIFEMVLHVCIFWDGCWWQYTRLFSVHSLVWIVHFLGPKESINFHVIDNLRFISWCLNAKLMVSSFKDFLSFLTSAGRFEYW